MVFTLVKDADSEIQDPSIIQKHLEEAGQHFPKSKPQQGQYIFTQYDHPDKVTTQLRSSKAAYSPCTRASPTAETLTTTSGIFLHLKAERWALAWYNTEYSCYTSFGSKVEVRCILAGS